MKILIEILSVRYLSNYIFFTEALSYNIFKYNNLINIWFLVHSFALFLFCSLFLCFLISYKYQIIVINVWSGMSRKKTSLLVYIIRKKLKSRISLAKMKSKAKRIEFKAEHFEQQTLYSFAWLIFSSHLRIKLDSNINFKYHPNIKAKQV